MTELAGAARRPQVDGVAARRHPRGARLPRAAAGQRGVPARAGARAPRPARARGARPRRSSRDRRWQRLAGDTGETVNLAVLEAVEAVNVAQVDGRHIVGVGSWTGRRTALHCTANGKVLARLLRPTPPGGAARGVHRADDHEPRSAASGSSRRCGSEATRRRSASSRTASTPSPCRVLDPNRQLRGRTQRLRADLPDAAGELLGRIAERCRDAAAEIGGALGGSARAA